MSRHSDSRRPLIALPGHGDDLRPAALEPGDTPRGKSADDNHHFTILLQSACTLNVVRLRRMRCGRWIEWVGDNCVQVPWHVVILDEAHMVKNDKALTTEAAMQLRTCFR